MSLVRPLRRSRPSRGGTTWSERQGAAAELEAHALTDGPDISQHPALSILGPRHQALGYLHARWIRLLGAAIESELDADSGAVVDSIWSAWRRVGQSHPGLAAVLHHYAADPAVRAADDRHRALVSSAAGCSPDMLPCFDPRVSPADQEELNRARLLPVHS